MAVSGNALRAGRAVLEVSLDTDLVGRQLTALQNRLGGLQGRLARLGGGGFGGAGGLYRLLVGASAARALAWPVQLAARLETTQTAFAALTGDAQKSVAAISSLEEFSKISLIDLDSLQGATEMLVGYGLAIDNAVVVTRALAAVSRGDSTRMDRLALAMAQINSATRLMGQEARQLAESGLPILAIIAERTGESVGQVRDRMAEGAVSAQEVNQALVDATSAGGRFGSLLNEMSKTLTGNIMKLWASFKLMVRPLGEAVLPLIRGFIHRINELTPALTKMAKENAQLGVVILAVAAAAASALVAFMTLGIGLAILRVAIGGVSGAFFVLSAVIGAFLSPTGAALAAVAALGAAFLHARGEFTAVANLLSGALSAAFTEVSLSATAAGNAMAAGDLAAAWKVVTATVGYAWAHVAGHFEKLQAMVGSAVQWFRELAGSVFGATGSLEEWFRSLGNQVEIFGYTAAQNVIGAFDTMLTNIQIAGQGLVDFFKGLFDSIALNTELSLRELNTFVKQVAYAADPGNWSLFGIIRPSGETATEYIGRLANEDREYRKKRTFENERRHWERVRDRSLLPFDLEQRRQERQDAINEFKAAMARREGDTPITDSIREFFAADQERIDAARQAMEAAREAALSLEPITPNLEEFPGTLSSEMVDAAVEAVSAFQSNFERRSGVMGGAGLAQRADRLDGGDRLTRAAESTVDLLDDIRGALMDRMGIAIT